MTALRCTAKLLKAMKVRPVAEPASARNRLGEWGANLVRIGRVQLVLAVSEPTRFAVVIDAAPYATVPQRLCEALFTALRELGVDAQASAVEVAVMSPLEIAASNSRSVLGTLNQFAWELEGCVQSRGARSAVELTRDMMGTIVLSPPGIDCPADRVREAFGLLLPTHDRRVALPL